MNIKNFDLDAVFALSAVLDKMDLAIDIESIKKKVTINEVTGLADMKEFGKEALIGVGLELIGKVMKNLHKARTEVKEFICLMTGKPMDEVSKMSLAEIKEFIQTLTGKEGFGDFFKQAGF